MFFERHFLFNAKLHILKFLYKDGRKYPFIVDLNSFIFHRLFNLWPSHLLQCNINVCTSPKTSKCQNKHKENEKNTMKLWERWVYGNNITKNFFPHLPGLLFALSQERDTSQFGRSSYISKPNLEHHLIFPHSTIHCSECLFPCQHNALWAYLLCLNNFGNLGAKRGRNVKTEEKKTRTHFFL